MINPIPRLRFPAHSRPHPFPILPGAFLPSPSRSGAAVRSTAAIPWPSPFPFPLFSSTPRASPLPPSCSRSIVGYAMGHVWGPPTQLQLAEHYRKRRAGQVEAGGTCWGQAAPSIQLEGQAVAVRGQVGGRGKGRKHPPFREGQPAAEGEVRGGERQQQHKRAGKGGGGAGRHACRSRRAAGRHPAACA